ncbi:MAG: hypothetical protein R2939_03145 [Kofleriaceae bacterium]
MTALPVAAIEELRLAAEELLESFRLERRAIVTLDAHRLDELAPSKVSIVAHMRELLARHGCTVTTAPAEIRELFAAIRLEAQSTAILATAASASVRRLMGGEPTSYDRRARPQAAMGQPLLRAAG